MGELPDIQKTPDVRGIAIDEVGVSNIRFPLALPLQNGDEFNTVANLKMTVSLPAERKGTHMSRFMIALNDEDRDHYFKPNRVKVVLERMLELLDAEESFLSMDFPVFLPKKAPVTDHVGIMDYDCIFAAMLGKNGLHDKIVGVKVNVASLCPCSKEISRYGAHNQRSTITIKVRPADEEFIWFEDLIKIAEACGSIQLYPILKRPDEKFVTESAYDNPKFVEDIVRDLSARMIDLLDQGKIQWFHVSSNNQESIHNHDAYAQIERGTIGPLLEKRNG